MLEADIIDLYFSQANIHDELVKRSEGVLSLFLSQKVLTDEQLDLIWSNCNSDDALQRSLIQTLSNLGSHVKPMQLITIIEKVSKLPKKGVKVDEIELLAALTYDNKTDASDIEF